MKLVALCGLQGAGKDTVADALPAQKFAFADVLYREVAEAWGVTTEYLKQRATKETPTELLKINNCLSSGFASFIDNGEWPFDLLHRSHSPRQILQWWGDYRRAQDTDYFIKRCAQNIAEHQCVVITDCRFQNEADMVRKLGGQIWQIVRPNHDVKLTGHKSESTGAEFSPDVVIVNCGTLDELRDTAMKDWLK